MPPTPESITAICESLVVFEKAIYSTSKVLYHNAIKKE
jgi:hypothetical protein